jgi:hypothetical protein
MKMNLKLFWEQVRVFKFDKLMFEIEHPQPLLEKRG